MAGAAQRNRAAVTRVAVLRDPAIASGTGQFGVIQAMAPSLRVEVNPVGMRDAGEIERSVAAFARSPNGGLIVTASGSANVHRNLIVTLAARHKLPAVYYERFFAAGGGLVSYGPDYVDQFRRAAGYVDRILKGEKPADLPIQTPTKYQTRAQPQDRQGSWPRSAANGARARRRGDRMIRREFIMLLGGAAAWPLGARAQQQAMPVVGILGAGSPAPLFTVALAQGLKESGYTESQNVRIEYRWARGAYDLLPKMADELVSLPVNVLATFGTAAARVVKGASVKVSPPVPVVFSFGSDPVAEGLVASLNRPGGNMTGATSIAGSLAPKRLELLRSLLGDDDASLAILINPDNPLAELERADAETAARTLGQRLEVLTARNESEIDTAFASLKQRHIRGLIIAVDTFYFGQMRQMAALASRLAVPAIGPLQEFAAAGGLMTYGPSIQEVNRQAAIYVGKVLKGARPADLPVMQPTKFELVINLKTAKALGLNVPPTLLARADEVIE